jgi:hypothetical protein
MMEIGGAMGPLYGALFMGMADECQGQSQIDAALFGRMLVAAREGVAGLGDAKVGDKTLMDTLIPAVEAYAAALAAQASFAQALDDMAAAAEAGKESTRDLVARIGRASRLGERSRGHLDAGATSCWLILRALSQAPRRPGRVTLSRHGSLATLRPMPRRRFLLSYAFLRTRAQASPRAAACGRAARSGPTNGQERPRSLRILSFTLCCKSVPCWLALRANAPPGRGPVRAGPDRPRHESGPGS